MRAGCIKIGQEFTIFRRLLLDTFGGLGLRWIKIDHQPFGERLEDYDPPTGFYVEQVDKREGNFTRLQIAIGAKIGYVIVK